MTSAQLTHCLGTAHARTSTMFVSFDASSYAQ